jgi:hypothetical protein
MKHRDEPSHPLRKTDGDTKRISNVETGDRLVSDECAEDYGAADVGCAIHVNAWFTAFFDASEKSTGARIVLNMCAP